MLENLKKQESTLNKDFLIGCILAFLCFTIPLVDHVAPNITAQKVAFLELIFVTIFFILQKKLIATQYFNFRSSTSIIFILWLACLLISFSQVFFENVPNTQMIYSAKRTWYVLMHLFFLTAAASYFVGSNLKCIYFLFVMPLSMVVIGIAFVSAFYFGLPIASSEFVHSPPFGTNIRYIGYTCTVGAIISSYVLLNSKFKFHILFVGAITLCNFILLVWLGGRGAILSVFICLFILTLLLKAQGELSKQRLTTLCLIIVSACVISHWTAVYEWNGIGRFLPWTSSMEANSQDLNAYSSNRLAIWEFTIEAIKNSIFFGYGPEGYYFLPERIFGLHPHNVFLQVFIEWGIIGGSLFLILFSSVFYKGVRLYFSNNRLDCKQEILLSLLIIFGLFLHALTDGTFYHAQPVFIIMLSFAIILSNVIANSEGNVLK